jgi:hypothetical protein
LDTTIVRNGFFFDPVLWQIVTFLGYSAATAGVPDGDTAPPTDATAANARAATPLAIPARKSHRAFPVLIG